MRRGLGILVLTGLALAPWPARAVDIRIDPQHSQAQFSVRLLWLRSLNGRFTGIAGEVTPDPHGRLTVDARIAVDSLVMDSARFRRWVLAPDFFDAARYPSIHFVSDPVAFNVLARGGALDGRLTLRGITRPMHFQLLPTPCAPATTTPCLIEAHGSVRRSDFGMTSHTTVLSDRVRLGLLIALERTPR